MGLVWEAPYFVNENGQKVLAESVNYLSVFFNLEGIKLQAISCEHRVMASPLITQSLTDEGDGFIQFTGSVGLI